uniref:Kelch repeat protein n=1 Tax=Rhabditophanes sp. KR3021 TaxID=114890 RepID=A0AC35UIG5_9BILA
MSIGSNSSLEVLALAGFETNSVYNYNKDNTTVELIGNVIEMRDSHCSETIKDQVFLFAGRVDGLLIGSIEKFDKNTRTSETLSIKCPVENHFFSSNLIDDKVYLIGGWSNKNVIADVEIFCPEKLTFIQGIPLPEVEERHMSVFIDNAIYVSPGYFEHTIRRFDFRDKAWTSLIEIPGVKCMSTVTSIDQDIYILGGDYESKMCHVYDIRANSYRQLAKPPIDILYSQCYVHEHQIFVFGGYFNDNAQIYDPKTDSWRLSKLKCLERQYFFSKAIF